MLAERAPSGAPSRHVPATAAALVVVLVCAEVPLGTAALAAAWIVAQAWAGGRILAALVRPARPGLGVGFAVGALATILSHVALRETPFGPVAWILPLVLGAAIRPSRTDAPTASTPSRGADELLLVAGLALVALAGEWFWTLPPGITLVAWAVLRGGVTSPSDGRRRIVDLVAAVLTAVAGAWTIARRPDVWWIFSADTHYYETLASSIARHGVGDNSLAGGLAIAYHWFSFAWVGIVADVIGAAPWVALTRIGPVAAAWFTVAVVIDLLPERPGRRWGVVGLAAFAASSAFGDWSLPVMLSMSSAFSQLFTGVWLVSFLWLVARTAQGVVRRPWPAFVLLTMALVGGKATHAAVCAAGVACVAVADAVRRRSVRGRWVRPAIASVATFLVASRLLIGSSNDITIAPGRWVLYVSSEYEQFGAPARLAIAAVLLTGMCAFPLLPWLLGVGRAHRDVATFLGGALLAAVSVTLFVVDVSVSDPRGINPNGIYFLHAATTLVAAWWAASLADRGASPDRRTWASALAVGAVAAIAPYAMPDPDSGSVGAILARLARSPAPLVIVLVAAAIRRVVGAKDARRWIGLALAASSMTFFLVNWGVTRARDERDMRAEGEARLGATTLREAAEWLRRNSRPGERFASNYFVENPRAVDLAWIDGTSPWTEWTPSLAFRSGNYPLLVAWSERGSLLQAPALVGAYQRLEDGGDVDAEIARRMSLSVAFAQRPDAGSAAALAEAGVRWFVVDLRRTDARDWSPHAVLRYENAEFAVLELAAEPRAVGG